MKTRYILATAAAAAIASTLFLTRLKHEKPRVIEIYTPLNIYYITGLKVENEANKKVIIFESHAELKEYISSTTAEDSNSTVN